MSATSGMSVEEVQRVLTVLGGRSRSTAHGAVNELIFRLATICGLHASEICRLKIGDVNTGKRPHIQVDDTAVPIYDLTTAMVLAGHIRRRKEAGATTDCPVLLKRSGKSFHREEVARRFRTSVGCLGRCRQSQLSIRSGRRAAAALLLARGASLSVLQKFLRHRRLETTVRYLADGAADLNSLYELETADDGIEALERLTQDERDSLMESQLIDLEFRHPLDSYLPYRSYCSIRSRLVACGCWHEARAAFSKCQRLLRRIGVTPREDRARLSALSWCWVAAEFFGKEPTLTTDDRSQ